MDCEFMRLAKLEDWKSTIIGILVEGKFSCEAIAERLLHAEVHRRPLMAPFLRAVTLGHLSSVKNLLASFVDANFRYGSNKVSALDVAVLMGHQEVVRALLEHGVGVDDANSKGETALHLAVLHGRVHPDVVDLLLSAGANIDARTAKGLTALHYEALRQGTGDSDVVVAMLLQRGAAVNAVSTSGRSPLHYAAQLGNLAATRALLAAGADVTLRFGDRMLAPLNMAASYDQVEVIKELARHGADLDAAPEHTGCTALHQAARNNHVGAIDALVEAGANVASQSADSGSTPLHLAAEYLTLEALRALLRHGAPVRALRDDGVGRRCEPPIHFASQQGGTQGAAEVVDLLLRWGADELELDDGGKTAAEVVGADVPPAQSLAGDADRVRKLLANAPADRAWRRRGLLLLCLARDPRSLRRSRRRRRSGSGGEGEGVEEERGVGQGAKERVLAQDGAGCAGGGVGDGDDALPSRDDVRVMAATTEEEEEEEEEEERGKCERTPSEVGIRRARSGDGKGGGGDSGRCRGGRGDAGSGGGLDGVVAMLLDFEEEGLFRTVVRFL